MKAYRGVDDKIRMFRPEENMKRMKLTAERAYLPVCKNNYMYQGMSQIKSDYQDMSQT